MEKTILENQLVIMDALLMIAHANRCGSVIVNDLQMRIMETKA
jgi:hypothetical protein